LTPGCTATKRDGEPCTLPATGPQALCWVRDPANAAARRRGASRGGKGRGAKQSRGEIAALKTRIVETVDGVLAGTLDRGRAAVAVQGYNALRAALELERKIKETDELEARLEALEAARREF
jgi:hypothetical protein